MDYIAQDKFALIQTEYLEEFDITTVKEVIYDINTYSVIESIDCGCYPGELDPYMSWIYSKHSLDVVGRDPSIIYQSQEQYYESCENAKKKENEKKRRKK